MKTPDLLKEIQQHGSPLLADGRATFVWQGAEAPYLAGDFNDWDANARLLEPVGANLWAYTLNLAPDAYMEYAFIRDPQTEERIPDPFNPRLTFNGVNAYNNYFYMPQGAPTPLIQRVRGVPRGKVTQHLIPNTWLTASHRARVHLYHPPVEGPCPLLVVLDGKDYLKRAHLPEIVDNLTAQGRIRPLALALVENGGPARMVEYMCSEATLGLLMTEVLPLAQKELNLLPPESGTWGILGASMGGLMALYAGLRAPGIFRQVFSQSGAFKFGQYPAFVFDLICANPTHPLRICMDVGIYEWLLPANQEMLALLRERNYAVTYHQYSAGHNYPAWSNDLPRGLELLFPREKAE